MYWDELNRQHAGMRVEVNDPFFKAKAQGIVSCPAENAPVLLLVGRKYHTFWHSAHVHVLGMRSR